MAGTSGLAPGVAPTFVGRQRELDQLLDWARESAAGRPRLVLLEGDAGVGKSRLVDEFLRRAPSNATVLLARCQEDLSVPYLPLANALKDIAPFGPLTGPTEDPEHTVGDGRLELFLSVTSALLDHAAQRPVLLVVDDFHWADRASVELVHHIVATASMEATRRDLSLLVVLPHRPATTAAHVERALARLARDLMTRIITMHGLDALGVNQLIASATGMRPSRDLVHRLVTSSDGNPLLVLSLLDRLEAFGALSGRDNELVATTSADIVGLPSGLDAVLNDRIATLSAASRRLLTRAAFLGDALTDEQVELVSGVPEDRRDALMQEAFDGGLVVETTDGVQFAHPQLRQLLYHGPRGRRRQEIHRDIADAIEATHGEDEEWSLLLAHHLLRAGDLDPDRVTRHVVRAANRATSVGAWQEAWSLYEAALESSSDLSFPSGYRALLHHRAAIAAWKDHDNHRAIAHADHAVEHARALGDLERWGPAAVLAAQARTSSGVAAIGKPIDTENLESFVAAAGDGLPGLRAIAHAELAELASHRNAPEAGLDDARIAWDLALTAADPAVEAAVLPGIAVVHLGVLDLPEALRWYERGAQPHPPGTDPLPRVLSWVRLGLTRWALGDHAGARHDLEGAVPFAQETMHWANQALAVACLAGLAVAEGDIDAAERWGEQAELLWRWSDFGFAPAVLYPSLAAGRVALGDREGAHRALTDLERSGGRGVWRYRLLVDLQCGAIDDVRDALRARPLVAPSPRPLGLFDLGSAGALLTLASELDLPEVTDALLGPLEAACERGVVSNPGWPFRLPDLVSAARTHDRR